MNYSNQSVAKRHKNNMSTRGLASCASECYFAENFIRPNDKQQICLKCQNISALEKTDQKSDNCILDIEDTLLKYKICKKAIDNVKILANEAECLVNEPEYFIYEYFNEIRVQVDLRREKLKLEIDNTSDQLIESIKQAETQCKIAVKNKEHLNTQFYKSNESLKLLLADLYSLKMNEQKLNQVQVEASNLQQIYLQEIVGLKQKLLLDNQLKFEFQDIKIDKIFGDLTKSQEMYFENSNILPNFNDQLNLINLTEFSAAQKFKLVYKATTDGFSVQTFHEKCDKIRGTLTIIKTTNESVFGGYTNEDWTGEFINKFDPNAFIFSYINKENSPIKINCEPNMPAIRCCTKLGPMFGSAKPDLVILDESNVNLRSYSQLASSYRHPVHSQNPEAASCFLDGKSKFQTVEIEVYQKL